MEKKTKYSAIRVKRTHILKAKQWLVDQNLPSKNFDMLDYIFELAFKQIEQIKKEK